MVPAVLDTTMTLRELLDGLVRQSVADVVVRNITLDSRSVETGSVFFAIQGITVDGRIFIREAVNRGAVAIVMDSDGADNFIAQIGVPVIAVDGLSGKLGIIAARFYGTGAAIPTVIGVTGTNGKTSCSQWIAQLWQDLSGKKAGVIGTLGAGVIGTPLAETGMTTPDVFTNHYWLANMRNAAVGCVAMEVSSHSLDQQRLANIPVTTALFTNVSRDHLDYHGSMDSYAAAKQRLFELPGLQHAVINTDDAVGKKIHAMLRERGIVNSISYGAASADMGVKQCKYHSQGMTVGIYTPWGEGVLETHLMGCFNVYNLLGVIGVLCCSGYGLQDVLDHLQHLQAVPGRMQKLDVDGSDITVVVDYAHTPDALQNVLVALRDHLGTGRLVAVFGCGGDRDRGKRPLMAAVAQTFADDCVITSDNPRSENPHAIIADIQNGFSANAAYQVIEDRQQAIESVIANAQAGDIILVAGKGHERYQEVGAKKIPFSDTAIARAALLRRSGIPGGRNS